MKKWILYIGALVILASCSTQKPLYTWDGYEAYSYKYLKDRDKESREQLMESYEKIINEQEGSRDTVPPGIMADYGFLLMQADQQKKGKKMLTKEVKYYPESKVFIDRILKMIEQ